MAAPSPVDATWEHVSTRRAVMDCLLWKPGHYDVIVSRSASDEKWVPVP